MAEQRSARLIAAQAIGPETRLLKFALEDGNSLGFVGGKYIIVNSGLQLPDGKTCKRAYSILSSDCDQASFEIAVRRIGMGSSFLHEFLLDSEMHFSGPWGKFVAAGPEEESIWIFATDTGITAALGLVQGADFKAKLVRTGLCWWVQPRSYFLPESFVRMKVPLSCGRFRVEVAPPIGDPARVGVVQTLLTEQLRQGLPCRAYLSGDGAVLLPLADALIAAGMPQDHIHVETFFNHPKRKSV